MPFVLSKDGETPACLLPRRNRTAVNVIFSKPTALDHSQSSSALGFHAYVLLARLQERDVSDFAPVNDRPRRVPTTPGSLRQNFSFGPSRPFPPRPCPFASLRFLLGIGDLVIVLEYRMKNDLAAGSLPEVEALCSRGVVFEVNAHECS